MNHSYRQPERQHEEHKPNLYRYGSDAPTIAERWTLVICRELEDRVHFGM